MRKIITLGVLAAILGLFSFVQAQIVPEPVSLSVNPAAPSPGEQITIRAATPTFDKNRAVFDWAVSEKSRPDLSGPGKDTINIQAGDLGSLLRVGGFLSSPFGGGGSTFSPPPF